MAGQTLPQTRFITRGGYVLDLSDLRPEKKVLLVVIMRGFAGQVCLCCSTQTRILSEMKQQFADANTEIVIVYPGPPSSVPSFLQAVQSVGGDPSALPTIVLDVNLSLVNKLDIARDLAKPTSIIVDQTGLGSLHLCRRQYG